MICKTAKQEIYLNFKKKQIKPEIEIAPMKKLEFKPLRIILKQMENRFGPGYRGDAKALCHIK